MTDPEFANKVVDLLEAGQKELAQAGASYYVWSWRRAREIHALLLQYQEENRRPLVVRLGEVG